MLKKTFCPGNDSKQIDCDAKNSGYAFFLALAVLLALSFLPLAVCSLGKTKMRNLEKKSQKFYQNLENQNKEVLENWKTYFSEENQNASD